MKSLWMRLLLSMALAAAALPVSAQGNLEIDTPAIQTLRQSMQQRHGQLSPRYASGAVGLGKDGLLVLRDASGVPLAQRGRLTALVAAENRDRKALYREIAAANGHPEWAAEVQATFARRWIEKAPKGWSVQSRDGQWSVK